MAAMQGANIPGADSRCLQEGTSSQSAFLRVARPGDSPGNFYLDLIVSKTDFGQEPIDSLQKSFDNWTVINNSVDEDLDIEFLLYPNPIVSEFKVINLVHHIVFQPIPLDTPFTFFSSIPGFKAILCLEDPVGSGLIV